MDSTSSSASFSRARDCFLGSSDMAVTSMITRGSHRNDASGGCSSGELVPMDNDAFENRRLAVMEEDRRAARQDGQNNNPTPMMVLVHDSSKRRVTQTPHQPPPERGAAFTLLDAEWNSAVTLVRATDPLTASPL